MTAKNTTRINFIRRIRLFVKSHPRLVLAGKAGLLLASFYLIAWRKIDPDFGWHLQAGNYIRAHGIPAHDVFTYTARQFPWIDHEWGNDVIVSFLYGAGGYALVAALYALLWTGALLLTGLRNRLSILYIALLAVAPYAGIRAIAWTAFLLAVVLRLVQGKRRFIWWLLPMIFALWANLHAGFIIGLFTIVYAGLYRRRPKLLGLALLCTVATALNAYGPRLYVEIARTLFDPALHSQVAEWRSFSFPLTAVLFIVLWAAGGVLSEAHTIRKWLRLSVVFLAASASATRNVPLFVVAATGELDTYVSRIRMSMPATINRVGKLWILGMTLIALLSVGYATYRVAWPLRTNPEVAYPVAAVAYLQDHGCSGQVFNDYNYGGYLIWKLPSRPVFIDGRMPSWKDPSGRKHLTEYYSLLANPSQYHRVFTQYNIQCSLLQKSSRNIGLIQLLQKDHWATDVETDSYILQEARNN